MHQVQNLFIFQFASPSVQNVGLYHHQNLDTYKFKTEELSTNALNGRMHLTEGSLPNGFAALFLNYCYEKAFGK